MKNERQGFFAIAQYSERPERGEFVNIGIVLFFGLNPYVLSKFSHKSHRVEKVFGVRLGAHFQNVKDSMEFRIKHEFSKGWSIKDIEKFFDLRSGKIRFLPLRSVLVTDANELMLQLFNEFVGDVPPIARGPRSSTKLTHLFRSNGVEDILIKPPPVHLSSGVTVEAPFAYQNGSFNLINAVSLDGEPDKVLERVSPLMIEGQLLYKETRLQNPNKLIVVGESMSDSEGAFLEMVAEQMLSNNVGFYRMDNAGGLIDDIRKSKFMH